MEQDAVSGMLTPPLPPERAAQMSADALAFIGDAVYQLMVADMLVKGHDLKRGELHSLSIGYAAHGPQSDAARAILPALTEREADVFRRGRNMGLSGAKRGDAARHAMANGLETLFGYLCVTGEGDRLRELFAIIAAAGGARD